MPIQPLSETPLHVNATFNEKYQDLDDPPSNNNLDPNYEDPRPLYNDDVEAQVISLDRRPSSRKLSSIPTIEEQNRLSRLLSGTDGRFPTGDVPQLGSGRPLPEPLPDSELYQVDFNGPDDPEHPFNWSTGRKLAISGTLALCSVCITWGSSIYSVATPGLSQIYHVKPVVTSLGVSFYVLGFAFGPIIWSPLSELYGRKLPMVLSTFLATCFFFASATSTNLQTLLITRFFSGATGSAPLTTGAAALSDIYDNLSRGIAVDIFAVTIFFGPMVAPIAGGFIVESYLGWRWTLYLTGIMTGASLLACIFLLEETYPPVLLSKKSERLREATGIWGIHSSQDTVKPDLKAIVTVSIARPIKMLFTEPIILLISIYNGFCYAILYLCLSSYPYTYVVKYHWQLSHAMLPYVGVLIGMLISGTLLVFYYEPKYNKLVEANGGRPQAEGRLIPMMPAGIAFAIGLMWFFWTGNYAYKVHWMVPTAAGLFIGFGLLGVFVPSINYIIDSYLFFAASAVASLTFLRSLMGAASPLFADYMFEGMGLNWAGLLLGLVAFALAPVPFLFHIYGKRLRGSSKFAFGD